MLLVSRQSKALSRLIADAREDRRLSYREMQERAEAAGHYISFQQLQMLAKGVVRKAPGTDQVAAIAAAIGEPIEVVRDAVFEQYYGYTPGQPPSMDTETLAQRSFESVVNADPELDDESKRHLLAQYRLLRAATAHLRGGRSDDAGLS